MIQFIGMHRVMCSDVMTPAVEALLQGGVDVMYTDPPWGDGNVKYWATLNKRMTGTVSSVVPYAVLLERILDLAIVYVRGPIFIETGPRWRTLLISAMKNRGLMPETQEVRYRAGRKWLPNVICMARMRQLDVTGLDGEKLVRRSLESCVTSGHSVFDPCCGEGLTARVAISMGARFVGNDVNAKRLEKTVAILR